MDKVGDLSDEELLARLRGHVGRGNVWCAELIAYLVEVDERRLDRIHACSSLWDFCTRKLGMSEGEAHRRIVAARTVRRFPQVLGAIERGEVHLCALYALRKHLTSANVDELLREASGKSTREIEKMLAARFPRPDVPACVELVATQALLSPVSPVAIATPSPASVAMPLPVSVVATRADAMSGWSLSSTPAPAPVPRARIEPLSATRYRIELTVRATTKETIDRIKDLMRHRNPTGELETILDASLALLLAQLEKERLGKTPRPRRRKPAEPTNACASAASATSAWSEVATRAPTAPVPVEAKADGPSASVGSETTMVDADGLARVETTASDPAAPVGWETTMADADGLARVETTSSEPAAPVGWETTVADADGLARMETTPSDPAAPVRSKTQTHAPGAQERADVPSGSQGVSGLGPVSAEPRVAERAAFTSATKASWPGSRHVPAEVRREVFARDGEQCTYVAPDGDRCPARGYLELDHIRPKARGGTETAANLRVRCRAHNALYAEQVFGRAHVAGRVHFRHRKCRPPAPDSFESAVRGLRSLGFREPEARRALETLATKREMIAAPIETLLREALLVLT